MQIPDLSPPPLEGEGGRLPIPVNIISGFLGSAKTTAIIRLLEQKQPGERWAIVVNEFGKVSIDGQTLQSKSIMGSVFDISGGCICCSAKIYLKENLEKIVETDNFDRIIIEPSGLGGIEMVSEIVASIPALKLMPVICMLDITGLVHLKFMRNLIYQSQISMADRIVFSKCDLVDSPDKLEELRMKFNSLFPEKSNSLLSVQLSLLLLSSADRLNSGNEKTGRTYIPSHQLTDSNYTEQVFSFAGNCVINLNKLREECQSNQAIIRVKGHIHLPEGWMLFNYTLTGIDVKPCETQQNNELIIISEKSETQNIQKQLNLISGNSINTPLSFR
jgi:G3E family GTPase